MNPWPNPVAVSIAPVIPGVAVVNANTGPFQATMGSFVPVDPTLGPTTILLPIPMPTVDLGVVMIAIMRAGGSTAPTAVIAQGVNTLGTILTWDPSWNGSGPEYATEVSIATDQKRVFSFVFLKSANLWVPGN